MQEPFLTYFNWSTGKDSALALYKLLQDNRYRVGHLLTSLNAYHDRVTMHGLRRELWRQQVEALGLPYSTLELPEMPDMATYEAQVQARVEALKAEGFHHTAFGDIFLEDLRTYREEKLAPLGIQAHFPLWKQDSRHLMNEFLSLGFKAVVVCTKAACLDASFVGRVIDDAFLRDLPADVDPCGENGEFHTFCFDGPIFSRPIPFTLGECIYREYPAPNTDGKGMGFWFVDLLPV
ncbi:MJ0570-related uncharacterized domain-containing protein [Catalinimonas alkaloidigena]|uniref:MJ0570-related uncharacterized domain-containing protein n=1 Tax=Catalinimonas alkaloidigena TaxID=1075417 RepID=A0A1G9LTJ7_9BACT|nr:ATP-binding protein [Catalinimonas alkaloidigena]SDL65316.1 MJ0570-related uncharacterized domain-containing protein [Catalinimonas alkaloidigena]